MRRIILSLFVVMFATLQLSSQTETFVKTMNSNGSRMLYKHIESFNKSKQGNKVFHRFICLICLTSIIGNEFSSY